jgi:Uma2 family endonuclease
MATDIRETPTTVAAEPQGTVLRGISWKTYLKLRDNPENRHVRMTYLDGELILMSPEAVHEGGAEALGLLIRGVTSGLGLTIKGIRTTTLRKGISRKKGGGKEPDNAFYFGENERRMRSLKQKGELNLDVDPPPDLAIEVDNKADSSKVLKLYARLGVPEVWRYHVRNHALWFGRLDGPAYVEVARSVALPRLTPALVLHVLDVFDQGEMDENAWFDWIKVWARDLPEAPAIA